MPPPNTPISNRISQDPRLAPYVGNCLGALDGTHIACYVALEDQPRYRNRKHFLSQNVLAICNFDLLFTYILPGWEGSAHDGRVLQDALSQHGLEIPIGQYYLGDAGYSNTPYCLVPYRGVRYHLKEQRQANLKCVPLHSILHNPTNLDTDLKPHKSFLISDMHLCVMLLNVYLEFLRGSSRSSKRLLDIPLKFKEI